MKSRLALLALSAAAIVGSGAEPTPRPKHAILIAGKPSHGPGQHEHNAGVLLFKQCLDASGLPIRTTVKQNADWPSPEELASADTLLLYGDGGPRHLLLEGDRMEQLAREIQRGCGLVCLHYAVEYPKDRGGPEMLDWIGGYFEEHWSVNPHWEANFENIPAHPIGNGCAPYTIRDEWYFHMRFAEPAKGQLTHLLSAIAPDSTMSRRDGPHEGNPAVRKAVASKTPQTTAWAFVRKDGGRGFGFTGGHFHRNWGNHNQRTLVLNAILWTAQAEVPAHGVPSTVTPEELNAHQDPKGSAQSNGGESTSNDHNRCTECDFAASRHGARAHTSIRPGE